MTNIEKLLVFSVRETSVEWKKAVVLDSAFCFGQCVSVYREDLEISSGQTTEESGEYLSLEIFIFILSWA